DVDELAIGALDLVNDGRRARDEVEVVLALESLLHDVHVQEPEKAAAEAETQCTGDFGLVVQCRIVQLELRKRISERFVVVRLHGEQTGEHARLHLLETRERSARRTRIERDRVADRRSVDILDPGYDEADLACLERFARDRFRRKASELVDRMRPARRPDPIFEPVFSDPFITRTSETTPT